MNIDLVRNDISENIGKKVIIKTFGLRNKNFSYVGIINQVYQNIFSVLINGEEKCFSYADLITKEVTITYV